MYTRILGIPNGIFERNISRKGLGSSLVLKPTYLQVFEFFEYYPLPEWGGNKLRVDFEENVIITENGAEWFVPPIKKIHLIC